MTANQIAYQKLQEDKRANKARETETHRSNVATEDQKRLDYLENWRSNLAKESETARSNRTKEMLEQNKHTDTLLENRREFDLKLASDHAHHVDDQNTKRGSALMNAATNIFGSVTRALPTTFKAN